MSEYTRDFFDGKRSWSHIKDRILANYLPPYIEKIKRRNSPILFIDAFAGPGLFEGGERGSPVIICDNAQKRIPQQYQALFFNKDKEHHRSLENVIAKQGYTHARAIHGDSKEWLNDLGPALRQNYSVFLYLDPFGLNIPFEIIQQFLDRPTYYSTEIIINLCAPILHRLAGRNAQKLSVEEAKRRHDSLTSVFGGDYWREYLLPPNMETKEREEKLIEAYMKKLSANGYLKYTGYCPIQETRQGRAKYYMIFAAPHSHAMLLMNENMLKSFEEFMHQQETEDTLFADMSWKDWRQEGTLKKITLEYVKHYPGEARKDIWVRIVKDNFMRFTESEYKKVTKELLGEGKIHSPTERRSLKILNDDCILYLTNSLL